jgi:hypothetical protein
MRRFSLYKLIKKIKSYSHISIFFNNRIEKPIRYGYRYVQRALREPKRLKFLKVQVRQPRLPVRRKTRYGRRLELRQKAIYMFNFGRLKKLVSYSWQFNRPGRIARFSNFSSFVFLNPETYLNFFGFSENPSFGFFTSRYQKSYPRSASVSRIFPNSSLFHFSFPFSGVFYFYILRVFFFRLYIQDLKFFTAELPFIFNFKTFSFSNIKQSFRKGGSLIQSFDFRFTQGSFGRLRLLNLLLSLKFLKMR